MLNKIILLITIITAVSFSQTDTLLIFSEIMFAPTSGNNEFIEIYNLSSTDSVDLSYYKIKYYTSTADQITDAGFGTILAPNSFAVIFENDYDIASGIYSGLVPSDALILKIADNSFGSSGMANTTSRPLWLLTLANDTVDYYFYSANNPTAISDEKIILNHDSLQTNWANSLVTNGTPGFTNSVTPVNYDLSLYSLIFSPSVPISGDNVTIIAKVKNNGVLSAGNYSIELFNDINKDSIPELSERIFNQDYLNLLPGDSVTASAILNSLSAGNYQIIARVNFSEDQFISDNQLIMQFTVFPPGNNYNDIVINEIMYAPSTGEPEWIELYNRTNQQINLKSWKLSDAASVITITTTDKFINPESFIVITKDSSILNFYSVPSEIIEANIPALNNTGDAVVIKDERGVKIDSVYYLPGWGGNTGGKSLERLSADSISNNPSNWAACVSISKATPGDINSITQKDYDIEVTDIIYNPKYPLLGENINLSAFIKNTGKNNAVFSIDLYEDSDLDSIPDYFIETISNISLSENDSGTYQFNYFINDLQNQKAYFVKAIYNQDQDTTNNFKYKTIEPGFPDQAVVINEIMFAPLGGEPEWIELFNNTDVEINLIDWSVWDVITTPAKASIKDNLIIPPKGYVVLTKDSSIFNYHRIIPSNLLKISLPSFNNDRDGVVLKDKRELTIDSVLYSNQWGGTNGFSLERISVTNSSNNQFNWASSYDIEQSTPGRINSVTPKEFDLSVTGISFNPRFPTTGDDISLTAKIKNNGNQTAQNFSVEFYIDSDSNDVVDLLLSSVTQQNLISGDSVSVTSTVKITNLQKKILTAVRVVYQQDEDILNNYYEKSVQPGYAQDIVKINEIMYNPMDGPEWIELINVSVDSINIKNWMISDVLTTPTKGFITNDDVFISPDEIFIVAKDNSFTNVHPDVTAKVFYTNFGSLGNTNDGVIIYDFRNGIIDSLFYRSNWGNIKGYSLERISLAGLTNDST
ncbi:MAG: lamin tail domain-containing protein, partial [Ignavibacteriaceae bacterium]|nr:lamin tail domain-containing protein [Ignavibacteriaceae bacterium]